MAITETSQTRYGDTVVLSVVSSLTGTVYYHWYLDGVYVGVSSAASHSFVLPAGDQSRVDVLDTNDVDFDPIANAPSGYPARRDLVFVRSLDVRVARYQIDQKKDSGAWENIGYLQHDPKRWNYRLITPRLDDLASYQWRVVSIDKSSDVGSQVILSSETIVRTPDAPKFTATLNLDTTILFEAA